MKNIRSAILLAWISLLLCSCGKNIFSNGDVIEQDRQLDDPFQIVEIHDNIDVKLQHCDATHPVGLIHIKTGENIIDKINAEIVEDSISGHKYNKLVITNDNGFNYLRPYNFPLEMTVYYESIYKILFNSNALHVQSDTIRGYDLPMHFTQVNPTTHDTIEYDSIVSNLRLEVQGGSGTFTILTHCYDVESKCFHGTSTLKIKGMAEIAHTFTDYDCHGIIDAHELETTMHYITSKGTNIVSGKAFHTFKATNDNIGYVYYVKYKTVKTAWFEPDSLNPYGYFAPKEYTCPIKINPLGRYADHIMPYPQDQP